MDAQRFGGKHTAIKLDLVEGYLGFYTTALKNQPFELVYIDAFAGNGRCEIRDSTGALVVTDGSALRAIKVEPHFQQLYLIEVKQDLAEQLKQKVGDDPRCAVICDDSNVALKDICRELAAKSRLRGVLFLDPFAMSVEFNTLKAIAETRALDVWYLFPTSAAIRNLAVKRDRMEQANEAALNRLLGTEDWQELYAPPRQADLFGNEADERERGLDGIEALVKKRLESIFPFVATPLRLPLSGSPMFSLYFACSNPAPAAIALARKPAEYLLKPERWQNP